MSTFSTTVTKAHRNATAKDAWGFAVSFCSRHNVNSPGYNRSPFEPKVTERKPTTRMSQELAHEPSVKAPKKKPGTVQVRPNTKRGQRSAAPTSKDIQLPELPIKTFLESSCELAMPRNVFAAVYGMSHGKPCIGCAYDEHSKTGCKAKQKLLRERGLIK